MRFATRSHRDASDDRAGDAEGRAPGKRALTDRLAPRAASAAGESRDDTMPRDDATATAGLDDPFALHLLGGGAPLPGALRGRFEQSLGTDLGDVRVHTGDDAAGRASALDARAFAHGDDIGFGAGAWAPDTAAGQHLLAHEVAHTVQQRGATASPQCAPLVSEPGDAAEVLAESAAEAMMRGAPTEVGRAPLGVHRFGASEHQHNGNQAAKDSGLEAIDLGDGHTLDLGDIGMLAGDLYGTADAIRELAKTDPGKRELAWAKWWAIDREGHGGAGGAGYDEPTLDEDTKTNVRDGFNALATNNVEHFSEGGTAGATYAEHHKEALIQSFFGEYYDQDESRQRAMIEEGFAQHFLGDMFSSGHVRTPRQEIEESYNKLFPDNGLIVESMAQFLADYLHDDSVILSRIGDIWGTATGEGGILKKARDKIVEKGGEDLKRFTVADIVSGAYHDADGRDGLDVVSSWDDKGLEVEGGFQWKATGDNRTGPATMGSKMAIRALKESLAELEDARRAGKREQQALAKAKQQNRRKHHKKKKERGMIEGLVQMHANVGDYKALQLVPTVDKDSVDNHEMNWHWGKWNWYMYDAVDKTIRGDVVPRLRAMAPRYSDGELQTESGLAIGAAWLALVDDIDQRGSSWLIDALGGF